MAYDLCRQLAFGASLDNSHVNHVFYDLSLMIVFLGSYCKGAVHIQLYLEHGAI